MPRRKTAHTVGVRTEEQTGLHVTEGGKVVSGDLVDAVLETARDIEEENRGTIQANDRQEERRAEVIEASRKVRDGRSLHDRKMDTKHQVAAQLRAAGVPPQQAEERARRAVEGTNAK